MEDWNVSTPSIQVNVSGHDAITLNGLPGSFYLNAGNLTGTIDPARIPGIDWGKITGKPTTLNGYGITDALTIAGNGLTSIGNTINAVGTSGRVVVNADSIDLAAIGTVGTYAKITTDAYGRVVSGTTLSSSDIPSLDASKITYSSSVNIPLTISTTSTTTGSVVIAGGVGCQSLWSNTINADGTIVGGGFQIKNPAQSWDSFAGVIGIGANNSLNIVGMPSASGQPRVINLYGVVNINDGLKLKTFTSASRPVPSASTAGQIWYNSTTENIEFATSTNIRVITSTLA